MKTARAIYKRVSTTSEDAPSNVIQMSEYKEIGLIKQILDECRENINQAVKAYQQEINLAISEFYEKVKR